MRETPTDSCQIDYATPGRPKRRLAEHQWYAILLVAHFVLVAAFVLWVLWRILESFLAPIGLGL